VIDMGYPIVLNLKGKKVVIIGAGIVAFKKAEKLLDAGAILYVLAQDINLEFMKLKEICSERLFCIQGKYTSDILKDCILVFAATSESELNERIKSDCIKYNILCNVVSDKGLSDFINPASFERGKVHISVSTDGESPKIAMDIRDCLEKNFNPQWEEHVVKYGEIRKFILNSKLGKMAKKEKMRILSELSPEHWDAFFNEIKMEVYAVEN